MKIKIYQEAKEYLESFVKPVVFRRIELKDAEKFDPLERMRVFLQLLGNPQEKFRSIQVSGTSGKGSTAYYISHILKTAGYAVGFSTSPHLIKINERIQINNIPISDEEFVNLLTSMIRIIEAMKKMEVGEPSYFEITMAMSFLYFAKQKVDIAVVEVGIEGRYDASNVLSPLAVVLTNIDLDHTDILGETVEEIAREAVSIIKNFQFSIFNFQSIPNFQNKNQIVITGAKNRSVIKIIEEKCREEGADLLRIDKDFHVKLKKESVDGLTFDFFAQGSTLLQGGTLTSIFLSMRGGYQIENAAVAIETVLQLKKHNFKISEDYIRKALKTSFFPGRFEIVYLSARGPATRFPPASAPDALRAQSALSGNPSTRVTPRNKKLEIGNWKLEIVLDGAHNPVKMRSFIFSLNKLYTDHKKIFVVAFKGEKDVSGMLKELLPSADVIVVTEFNSGSMGYSSAGAVEVSSIKYQVSSMLKTRNNNSKIKIFSEKDPKRALEKAVRLACHDKGKNVVVVTGSLYLVGEIKQLIVQQ